MAGYLPKSIDQFHKIPYARIAIIAAMWHPDCVNAMVDRALQELSAVEVTGNNISVHHIPGSLELPYAAQSLFESDGKLDAIIAFGIILKGETSHNDSVMGTVVEGFSRISERFGKPIINEVIGVNAIEDAYARADQSAANKGVEAVFALTEILHWKQTLPT